MTQTLTPRQQAYLQRLGVTDISQLTQAQRAWLTIKAKQDGVAPPKPEEFEDPLEPVDLEALGVQGLSLSNLASTRWTRYGIVEPALLYGDKPSGYKAVMRKGKLVMVAHDTYKLLPNEEVLELADETAKAVGAVPFDEFRGQWYAKMGDHVVYNRDETQMHALYAFNEPVDIGGCDMIQLGIGIHNSIDGSYGFGVGTFTFRHACANMVLMGLRGYSMRFDDRKTLAWVYQRHSAGLKVDRPNLQETILQVIDRGRGVVEYYRQLTTLRLNEEIARRIAESQLPARVLPDYIEVETVDDQRKFAALHGAHTTWDAYNSITAAIWHNAKSDIDTKINQFNTLHEAIPIVARRKQRR